MIELGNKFVVMGDWDTSPEPEGKTVIRMPVAPHHTYGCWHDTTRLCVEALEEQVKPGMTVLDYGTGSGILAMVAHCLGASPVYATELDPEQVEFAKKVWYSNDVPVTLVGNGNNDEWQEGSIGHHYCECLPEVDLCVANIGDHLWDLQHGIKAKVIINISNAGKLATKYAS